MTTFQLQKTIIRLILKSSRDILIYSEENNANNG